MVGEGSPQSAVWEEVGMPCERVGCELWIVDCVMRSGE